MKTTGPTFPREAQQIHPQPERHTMNPRAELEFAGTAQEFAELEAAEAEQAESDYAGRLSRELEAAHQDACTLLTKHLYAQSFRDVAEPVRAVASRWVGTWLTITPSNYNPKATLPSSCPVHIHDLALAYISAYSKYTSTQDHHGIAAAHRAACNFRNHLGLARNQFTNWSLENPTPPSAETAAFLAEPCPF